MEDDKLKDLLKKYLTNKEFDTYNEILIKQIIDLLVKKVQLKNPRFIYSTLIELVDEGQKALNPSDLLILKRVYTLEKQESQAEYIANELMEIYMSLQKNN